MTLLDAPKFDTEKAKSRALWTRGIFAALLVFLVGMWFFTGRPIDFPWTWWTYWAGERDVNQFLLAVEQNQLQRAYGIWENDLEWTMHPDKFKTYPFQRFSEDWGPNSTANDYGTITSHKIVARKLSGNQLIVAALINGRKSHAVFLAFDRNQHTLGFSPFELTIDPSGVGN